MWKKLALLVVVLTQAGCGGEPPPEAPASEQAITEAVLEWHRLQAARDGDGACRLLTEKTQAAVVEADAEISELTGKHPADDCAQAISDRQVSHKVREALLNTQIDAVRIENDRATAIAHTAVTLGGVLRQTPPAEIGLRWTDGRWLID